MKTIVLTPASGDLPPGYSETEFHAAIERAAQHWSFPNVPCAVRVDVAAARTDWRATQDGLNVVAYRGRSWCHNERCGSATTFPLSATAMTTTYPEGAAGDALTEADVELNGVGFEFTDQAHTSVHTAPRLGSVGLESVLVHEIGHVLGLRDVCADYRGPTGRPIATTCSPAARASVMFAANAGVMPTPSDVGQLCSIYPPESTASVTGTAWIHAAPFRPSVWASAGGSMLVVLVVLVRLALQTRRMRRGVALARPRQRVTRSVTARRE